MVNANSAAVRSTNGGWRRFPGSVLPRVPGEIGPRRIRATAPAGLVFIPDAGTLRSVAFRFAYDIPLAASNLKMWAHTGTRSFRPRGTVSGRRVAMGSPARIRECGRLRACLRRIYRKFSGAALILPKPPHILATTPAPNQQRLRG